MLPVMLIVVVMLCTHIYYITLHTPFSCRSCCFIYVLSSYGIFVFRATLLLATVANSCHSVTQTHTHTHTYIYIYTRFCQFLFRFILFFFIFDMLIIINFSNFQYIFIYLLYLYLLLLLLLFN